MESALIRAAAIVTGIRGTEGIAAEEFERLVRQNQQRIYRVLLGVVRDPDAADTLTQECFLRAYEKRASFRGKSSVRTWLVRIALNLARDHAKNRRAGFWRRLFHPSQDARVERAVQVVAAPMASPETTLLARQDVETVWLAAEELSPQQRAVFTLRFAEEMTLEEIAEATGLGLGTVKAHLHRAVNAVRKKLRTT